MPRATCHLLQYEASDPTNIFLTISLKVEWRLAGEWKIRCSIPRSHILKVSTDLVSFLVAIPGVCVGGGEKCPPPGKKNFYHWPWFFCYDSGP